MAVPILGLVIILSFIGFWAYNTKAETTTLTQVILPSAECQDEGDNDFDGLIDFPDDPGCIDADDDSEDDAGVDPQPPSGGIPGTEPGAPTGCDLRGDINRDCKIDLTDFSILTYWWDRTGFPARADLNNDGKIDLTDFSILVYYWRP